MRLGFHYHIPAVEINGAICMPGYLGRFIDSLADHCESMVCFMHTPLTSEVSRMDYALQSKNIKLVSIGPHAFLPRRVLRVPAAMQKIRAWRDQLDGMLIRGPSPLLPDIALACGSLPTVLLLVGDILAGIDDLPQPRWRKEAIRSWWRWNNWRQLAVAKRSLTFVNSRLLYRQLQPQVPNLVETRTTTLTEVDFYMREDTCQAAPIHLLYTGRMDRSKGILNIVEAVSILVLQGYDLVFDMVGMMEKGDPILDEALTRAASLGIAERVRYHGYQKLGPDLFAFYRRADIFLMASQSSEGFPRTIWEAMANSLPVVATKVGSIPFYLSGKVNVLLAEPNNISSLTIAINDLLTKPSLRKEIIRNGRELAEQNTLGKRSAEMISTISAWLK